MKPYLPKSKYTTRQSHSRPRCRHWVWSAHGASCSSEIQLENRDRTEQSFPENVSTNSRSKAASPAEVRERERSIFYILLCLYQIITFQFSVWLLWLRPGGGGRHYPCSPHHCPLIPAVGDCVWNDLRKIIYFWSGRVWMVPSALQKQYSKIMK